MKFKFVTMGQDPGSIAWIEFTPQGNSLKPLAPTNLRGTRNAAGDLLIQWTPRARIGGGMRPNTGMPLAEEREEYTVRIYSGATLKREARSPAAAAVTERIAWTEFFDPENNLTITSDQTLEFTDVTENAAVLSAQTFHADFTAEFVINSNVPPTYFGVCPLTVGDGDVQNLGNGLFAAQGYPYVFVQGSGNARPMGLVAYQVSVTAGDKVSLARRGDVFRFYVNAHTSGAPAPILETSFKTGEILRLFAKFTNGVGMEGLAPSSIAFGDATRFNYTANQQIENFGSVQSTPGSVKVHVAQMSAMVGAGIWAEAML